MRFSLFLSLGAVVAFAGVLAAQNPREVKVKKDREAFANDEHWIYNDLARAMEEARKENKPLMVVFRCIP